MRDIEIPAATISDVNLKRVQKFYPAEVKKIEQLGRKMGGAEGTTDAEFCQLIELLCVIGEKEKAEYLLRRNLEVGGKSHKLYFQLFGHVTEKEFESAITSFKREFGVNLTFIKQADFLEEFYRSSPVKNKKRKYKVLSAQCEITFSYSEEHSILADVVIVTNKPTVTAEEYILLYWYKGSWLSEDEHDNLNYIEK